MTTVLMFDAAKLITPLDSIPNCESKPRPGGSRPPSPPAARKLRAVPLPGAGYWAAMSEANVEVVRDQFEAVNERDFPRAMSHYAEDVVLVVRHEAFLQGGTFEGREAVGRWFGDWFRTFAPDYRFEIEETRDLGDVVFLYASHRGRGRSSGVEVQGQTGYVYTLHDGKIVRVELHPSRAGGTRGGRARGIGRGAQRRGLLLVVAAGAALAAAALVAAVADEGRPVADGRRVRRGVGLDAEDPEAQGAVRDLEVVVEPLEQVALRLEAVVAVVGLVALIDLVGHLPQPPVVGLVEGAALLDLRADVGGQSLAGLIGDLGVDHQDKFVVAAHGEMGPPGREERQATIAGCGSTSAPAGGREPRPGPQGPVWLTRIRWERAARPLAALGAGLAALALLPALFEGGAPPPLPRMSASRGRQPRRAPVSSLRPRRRPRHETWAPRMVHAPGARRALLAMHAAGTRGMRGRGTPGAEPRAAASARRARRPDLPSPPHRWPQRRRPRLHPHPRRAIPSPGQAAGARPARATSSASNADPDRDRRRR